MTQLVSGKILSIANGGAKKSNLEMVIDYLIAEPGAVELNEHQKSLLHRLEVVDQLFSTGQYNTKEMAFIHAQKCNQSVAQSKRDIQDAEFAFGASRKSNRAHKIYRHYDRLEAIFIALHKSGLVEQAAKISDCMTKVLALMPEDKAGNRTPAQIIMNITEMHIGQLTDNPITDEEAEEFAMKHFEIKGKVLEDEDHDDTDEGPEAN